MSPYKKTLIILALCVTMAQPVQAVTQAELLAQIDALLKIVLSLQEQVRTLTGANAPTHSTNSTSTTAPAGTSTFLRPTDYDICITPPTRSLALGDEGTDVLALQEFLRDNAQYTGELGGYLGQLTQSAIKRFQTMRGIVSSGAADVTGYGVVGPRTRAAIATFCASSLAPTQITTTQTTPQTNSVPSGASCPSVATLPENFCSSNSRAQAVYATDGCQTGWMCATITNTTSQTTTVTTPSASCGTEYVPVCARMTGADAPVTFSNQCYMQRAQATFVSSGVCPAQTNTINRAPVIESISGPTELSLNQTGTWTINATDADNDTLQYKMIWGDEQNSSIGNITELANSGTFSSAKTFTHFYSLSSTYTLRAIAKDSAGATHEKTHVVRIGGGSGQCYSNITLYPEGSVRTCITRDGGGGTVCAPTNYAYVCRTNEWQLEQTTN